MQSLDKFHHYVYDFYGPDGIYSLNASMGQIMLATQIYLRQCANFMGDSWDREQVHNILKTFT